MQIWANTSNSPMFCPILSTANQYQIQTEIHNEETEIKGACVHVSLSSMQLRGGFASEEVIALSALGDNLGRKEIMLESEESENKATIIIKDCVPSCQPVRPNDDSDSTYLTQRQDSHDRPTKMRKFDEHSVKFILTKE